MRGEAQPDGRPAVELIETLVLLSLIVAEVHVQRHFQLTTSCCNSKISGIKLRNHKIEIYVCPVKSTLSHGEKTLCGYEHLWLKYNIRLQSCLLL